MYLEEIYQDIFFFFLLVFDEYGDFDLDIFDGFVNSEYGDLFCFFFDCIFGLDLFGDCLLSDEYIVFNFFLCGFVL